MTIKSVISSIFGYVLGNNCKPNKLANEEIQVIFAGMISIICLTSLFITNFMYFRSLSVDVSNLNEISDLLLLSVGFLISKSKEYKR